MDDANVEGDALRRVWRAVCTTRSLVATGRSEGPPRQDPAGRRHGGGPSELGLGEVEDDRGRCGSKKLRRELLAAAEELKARQHDYELDRLSRARHVDVERKSRVERELTRDQLLVWGVLPNARWREHGMVGSGDRGGVDARSLRGTRCYGHRRRAVAAQCVTFGSSTAPRATWDRYLNAVRGRPKGNGARGKGKNKEGRLEMGSSPRHLEARRERRASLIRREQRARSGGRSGLPGDSRKRGRGRQVAGEGRPQAYQDRLANQHRLARASRAQLRSREPTVAQAAGMEAKGGTGERCPWPERHMIQQTLPRIVSNMER